MTRPVTRLAVLSRHPRMLLALPAAALAVTLAACGSSAGPVAPKPAGTAHSHAQSAPAHAAAAAPPKQAGAAHHHHHHHSAPPPAAVTAPPPPPPAPPPPAPAQTANPIPQGNGGDQDADNNGGPSDGDGNI